MSNPTIMDIEIPEQFLEITKDAEKYGISLELHEGFFNLNEVKLLVYGDSGAGKTVFASTWPDCVFLDIDKGMSSVVETVGRVRIDEWNDLDHAVTFLEKHEHGFLTVVVDSLNEMQEKAKRNIVRKYTSIRRAYDDLPSQSDYGKLIDDVDKMMRRIHALPMNVVFICQVAKQEYATDMVQPQLIGRNTANMVTRMMDVVGYLYKQESGESGGKERVMVFDAVNYVTKDRSDLLPAQVKNPSYKALYSYWQNQSRRIEKEMENA